MINTDEHRALNLYSRQAGVFTADQLARAEGFAAEATRALRLAWRLADQAELTGHLEAALATRSIIDQAWASSWAKTGAPPTRRSKSLRAASSHRNLKLRDIATTSSPASAASHPAHPVHRFAPEQRQLADTSIRY
jgi:hypothetical protein